MLKSIRLAALLLFLVPFTASSQFIDGKFVFPDIPGYYTLKCDFHMHTVFSDGTVWPTVRVREAVNEGLDAIAISEHLEYWSHKNYLKGDHNSSYDIAKPYTDKNDLILIKACEITKGMPPGHFNFLFIKDANTIDSVDWEKAIVQANEQGAFVFWNHPGWRMKNTIPVWYKEHSWLLQNGLVHGIEIVNENEYYPLAQQWCIDSNLTMLGNSDIHDPLDYFYDKTKGEHRAITLVFAKEKTEAGIRDALDNGRTAIYYKDKIIGGDEWFLKELFYASISIYTIHNHTLRGPHTWETVITNDSGVPIHLEMITTEGEEARTITLLPEEGITVDFPLDDLGRKWKVANYYVAPGKCLTTEYISAF